MGRDQHQAVAGILLSARMSCTELSWTTANGVCRLAILADMQNLVPGKTY